MSLIKSRSSRKLVLDEFSVRIFRGCNLIPQSVRPFFWDTNVDNFNPVSYPAYTIARVLEFGDDKAVRWLRDVFSEAQIIEVLRTERRLSRRSANFWALVYHLPSEEVAALSLPSEFLSGNFPKQGVGPNGTEGTRVASGNHQRRG